MVSRVGKDIKNQLKGGCYCFGYFSLYFSIISVARYFSLVQWRSATLSSINFAVSDSDRIFEAVAS